MSALHMNSAPLLEIKGLEVTFSTPDGLVRGVNDISFTVAGGSCTALVGESGSGKSLTALSVVGLLPGNATMTAGSIHFKGRSLLEMGEGELQKFRGGEAGMIFQEPMSSLNPVYTVGFHLAEAIGKESATDIKARSIELLREVGIPDPQRRLAAYPHQLSGGLCQRVLIACALARNPSLIIADEPTTALDVTVEAQIMALLDRLKVERSVALLLVTHDLGLVAQHADKVVVAYAGYTVEEASVKQLFAEPLHPYTVALMNAMPRYDSGGEGKGGLTPIRGNIPHPAMLPPGCPFADRCDLADGDCAVAVPELRSPGQGRMVRCIKAG